MTGEQNLSALLAEQCDRMLTDMVNAALLRAVESGKEADMLISAIDELGLSVALVPERAGGAGLQWADVGGVFETLGYHAAPVLLGESIIANWAVARAGLQAGTTRLGLAPEILRCDTPGRAVSGTCVVPWSDRVEQIVLVAKSDTQQFLCLLHPASGAISTETTVGRDCRKRIVFEGAAPVAAAVSDLGPHGLQVHLAVLRSAQIAGALSRMLSLSIDYGNTRIQFGRPIGKFQAIQHMIAELAAEAAAAKAGVQMALRGFDSGEGFECAAIAKIRASVAAGKGSAIAHEVHGAIGVTEEHVLHYYTRRAWQWRLEAGDEHLWSERLGRLVLETEGAALWPRLVAFCDR